ncbi:MAG: nucleoside 2-deoxyribosyltransferase [Erysipelotrichaceae bacterium]|nr:nucleoside 2-deoxyribosyltransferase [Erysipelotrichaceae bacterium]
MKYYYGNREDSSFAIYEKDGHFYPVFVEKYGTDEVSGEGLELITDQETNEALDKYMQPYEPGKPSVYMAGPLFNEGDRFVNQTNSDMLRNNGFTTFLPQEIVITNKSSELVKAACFFMDLKAIMLCDVLLANCNGIEIDSGTAAEIGLGYGLNKKMVLYKSDVRNYYNERFVLNNFVGGLVGNKVCRSGEEVLKAVKEAAGVK